MLPAIKHLLAGYISLADELVAHGSTQESTLTRLDEDPKYRKALQGLRLVAKHELTHLMQVLVSWRAAAMADLTPPRTAPNDYQVLSMGRAKKVILECLFLEPTMLLLEELTAPPVPTTSRVMLGAATTTSSALTVSAGQGLATTTSVTVPSSKPPKPPQALTQEHVQFCTAVQDICFQWLINPDEGPPYPELPVFRNYILHKVAQALGAVSLVSVSLVGNPFMLQLKKLINPDKDKDKSNKSSPDTLRAQTLRLCTGMQYVQLSFGSELELRHAINFLQGVIPFDYVASIKKSQVHHAMAEMLTKMLTPLVLSGQPHMCDWLGGLDMAGLMEWYNLIFKYKDQVWSWMQKHDKHIRSGWMFAAVLVCLLDSEKYTAARDQAADFFLRQLKNKDYRGLAARCLVMLITSLLVRFGKAQAMPRPELVKLLDKMVRGPPGTKDAPCLLTIARKGYLNREEIKEMLSPWAKLAPDYVLGVLIELIQSDVSDCVLAAMMTAHEMLAVAPPAAATLLQGSETPVATPSMGARLRASRTSDGGMLTGGLPPVDTMELMRAGYHPVDLLGLGNLMSRFTAALSKPWSRWHEQCASAYAMSNPDNQGVRGAAVFYLRELLRLVPYTRPEVWVGQSLKPLEVLPGYLSHPELSPTAARVLDEIMRSSPHLRNQLLIGVAAHCVSLPDDNAKALRDGLSFLRSLINTWTLCVKARLAGEVEERSIPEAGLLDLHRLEGAVWASGLCYHDEVSRELAIQVLSGLRTLHHALLASPGYLPPPAPALLATHLSAMPVWSPGTPSGALTPGLGGGQVNSEGHDPLLMVTRSKSATAAPLTSVHSATGTGRTSGSGPGGGLRPGHQHKNSHTSLSSSQDGTGGSEAQGHAGAVLTNLIDYLEPDVTYMYDVLEHSGPDIVRASYWDWGELSDLWSQYLDLPPSVGTCIGILSTAHRDGDSRQRLTRLMIELAKTMALVSPVTCAAALHDLCMGRLARLTVKDRETGRMGLPQDTVEGVRKAEMWRLAGAVAAVLPSALKDTLAHQHALTLPNTSAPQHMQGSISSSSLSIFGGSSSSGTPTTSAAARAAASRHPSLGLSVRDIIRCHISLVFPGVSSPSLQGSSIMALGHVHPAHHEVLLDEVAWMSEECSGNKAQKKGSSLLGFIGLPGGEAGDYVNKGGVTTGRNRQDECRRVVAHIMRLLACTSQSADTIGGRTQRMTLKWKLQEWIGATYRSLWDARLSGDLLWDNLQVAYCFAAVMIRMAAPLCEALNQSIVTVKESSGMSRTSGPPGPTLRKAVFDTLAFWTADGQHLDRDYRGLVRAGIRAAVDKSRVDQSDVSVRRDDQERELRLWAAALDQRARSAMAAMLVGPVFDADARRPQGPVLQWVDRLLQHDSLSSSVSGPLPTLSQSMYPSLLGGVANSTSTLADLSSVPGPSRVEVGKLALMNLLQSNTDLFPVYLDKSYDSVSTVASTYFQALCEVYCTSDIKCPPYILVSLILYKMVDPQAEVREDARHLLEVLAEREWGTQPSALQPSPSMTTGILAPRLYGRSSVGGVASRVSKAGSEGGPASSTPPLPHSAGKGSGPHTPGSGLQSAPNPSTPRATEESATLAARFSASGAKPAASSPLKATVLADGTPDKDPEQDQGLLGAWLPPDGGSAFSTLLDTYQENQHNMSELLANTHPELAEALCEEMMTRALDCKDPAIQQPVLNSLLPWMNILIIQPQWKGTWCDRLLKSMYYVTQEHGRLCPYEIQNLWCTLAALKDNVRHMLLFLVDLGMEFGQQDMASLEGYLAVVKRICLYLARTHPQFTIDQLQLEVSKQIQEVDTAQGLVDTSSTPVEFETMIGDLSSAVYIPDPSSGGLLSPTSLAHQESSWPLAPPPLAPESSTHTSYEMKGGIPADWRSGPGGQAGTEGGSVRTTHSMEGGMIAGATQLVARIESTTSSRSSLAASSMNDSAIITSAARSAAAAGVTGSSPRVGGGTSSLVSSSGGAMATLSAGMGGVLAAGTGDGPGSAIESRSMHDGGASPLAGGGGPRGSADVSMGGAGVRGSGDMVLLRASQGRGGASQVVRSTGGGRALISRPELAMCLLSEVAFACDEEFMREGCLPMLLHACCVMLDAESPLVHYHAALLLTALVHSVGSYHQEQAQEQGQQVDMEPLHHLVRFLQSMRGKRLWAYEDTSCAAPVVPSYTALQGLVTATVRALHWMDDLRERWASHALDWALHSCSRHLSGRSFQVFRALSPQLDADLLTTLLLCLHTCLDNNTARPAGAGGGGSSLGGSKIMVSVPGEGATGAPRSGVDCALEVLNTLQALVQEIAPPSRLVLYPQVFWVGLSLLHSHVVALYSAGLSLLASYMRNLNLQQSKVLNVLLAAAPGVSGNILVHASAVTTAKLNRASDKGEAEAEEPESWTLGAALLQLPVHDTSAQRHVPLAAQQLLLRGLQLSGTAPDTLNALADMASVLEVQGAALNNSRVLRENTNTYLTGGLFDRDLMLAAPGNTMSSMPPDNTISGSGGPYDSLRKHRLLRLDAHQALLGASHSQLFVTCLSVILHALAVNNTSVTVAQSRPEAPAAQAALARCLVCLGRACDAHGLSPMVAPLQQAAHVWADGGTGVPLTYPPSVTKPSMSKLLLRQLCAGMAGAFLPCYGPLLLHHCLNSLSQTQPANKHLAVLQLLHALFTVLTENLQQSQDRQSPAQVVASGPLPLLGPTAMRMLTHSSLLSPLLDKTQGPLAPAASEALSAVVAYTAARTRTRSSTFGGLDPALRSSVSVDIPGAWPRVSQSGTEAPVVPRTLHPASVNTAAAIRRVIDTLGHNVWRGHRVTKLLPHLGSTLRPQEG